ncbi:hypothetical protein MPH_06765 [Macrophomina phaseolina MS6]|uniref:Uncharacterized protein n=2 Tax=Macrophomina phaseolina TaxID=35725 RepID=K2R1J1_MACPH|nr:hypothetical protein MPH_06765 [Macrophomina phaseolina MS6]KAH7051177.1 hypothetical protein B0J12DRAFT_79655 [Macrophomina phaseolina]
MPMRWTPDKDQLMLLMLLKTHNISINYGAIADAWPADQGEKPTPRAISERLIKMRKQIGSSGGQVAAAIAKQPRSVNSTPSKPKAPRPTKPAIASTTPSAKRRRTEYIDDDDVYVIPDDEVRALQQAARSSPTPATPRHATTPRQTSTNRHPSTSVAPHGSVIPSSERSPTRTFAAAPASRASTAFSQPGAAANTVTTNHTAAANSFAARTPASMEPAAPAAGIAGRTPVSMEPTGAAAAMMDRLSVARSTPRRASTADIKLEESISDDDGFFDGDSNVSDWEQDDEV